MAMGRILVVEGDEHVRKTVGLVLKQKGYDVLEAADGEGAVAAVESQVPDGPIHAVICDIGLPVMSGKEVVAFLRAKLPAVPIIVMTGQPDVQSAASLFKQGVVDYLVKPVLAQTVVDAVRRAIGEKALLG